ncbi:MAG: hypothetical protein PUF29_05025, partial [Anaerobutyricum hallii]|uniref:hypothetical protein n=1 Tax=Anaerobutyricum hallii TaxID=39488 RepID=UPI002432CA58
LLWSKVFLAALTLPSYYISCDADCFSLMNVFSIDIYYRTLGGFGKNYVVFVTMIGRNMMRLGRIVSSV